MTPPRPLRGPKPSRRIKDKEARALVAAMISQGWRWDEGAAAHGKLWPADKAQPAIIVYYTPRSGAQRLRTLIERAGGKP
jgi:hypothetical protein